MDVREVIGDNEETLRAAFQGMQKNIWTAMPCIVAADSEDGHTCSVQIAVQGVTTNQQGQTTKVNITLLSDVLIQFGGGGGVTLTHPVKKGDEGVVVFMARNQDGWYQSGGVQPPVDTRMHALSDARYFPGGRSVPKQLKNVSPTAYQMRSDDANHVVSLDPASGVAVHTTMNVAINAAQNVTIGTPQTIALNAAQGVSITAPGTNPINGTLTVNGDIILNGTSLKNHIHGGVTPGGGVSGRMQN